MILNKQRLLFFVAIFAMAMLGSSCVEIPDKAPDPPALKAEFRFMSLNPTGFNSPTSFLMAEGPTYTSYTTYTLPGNATPTNYLTFNSGSKRIVYNNGVQNDTLTVTFETDQRATLLFARNQKHDTIAVGLVDAIKLPYRYIFASNGITDTTLVRFTNLVQRGREDKIDVYRSDSTLAVGTVVVDNLRYGLTSAALKIPVGKSYKFFFTHYDETGRVFKDSIVVTGQSRKIYSVFAYDKYDSTAVVKNANVKVKVLEEL